LKVTDTLKTTLTTDKDKVSQVLRNFLSKFPEIYQNRYYYIKVEESGNKERPVMNQCQDTGIGIALKSTN